MKSASGRGLGVDDVDNMDASGQALRKKKVSSRAVHVVHSVH
ncbi:MAG: hypothetical protein ACHQT8_04050 [Chlamydiales bacterium]